MEALEVRLVHLPAMRFACASGFGKEPEAAAWKKLLGWAQACGMSQQNRRFFGFNNPDPAPGSPNYGYDQWMTLQDDETILPDAPVTPINFTGGYYAVTRCRLSEIGEAWQALVRWLESSPNRMVAEQCLEEALTPEIFTGEGEALFAPEKSPEDALFDLYLPIKA